LYLTVSERSRHQVERSLDQPELPPGAEMAPLGELHSIQRAQLALVGGEVRLHVDVDEERRPLASKPPDQARDLMQVPVGEDQIGDQASAMLPST
jgi:hypothetical protein